MQFTRNEWSHRFWHLTKVDCKMLVLGKDVRKKSTSVQLSLWDFEGDTAISAVDGVKDLDRIDCEIQVTPDDVTNAKSANTIIISALETKVAYIVHTLRNKTI